MNLKGNLSEKKCIPCESGVPPMNDKKIEVYLKKVKGWSLKQGRLSKHFKFKDFKKTLEFVNKVGKIAEQEGHHPNIYFTWGKCEIQIYTHAINGLSENDFILAAKIDEIR